MHMGRFMIVGDDDDAQPIRPIDGDHKITKTYLVRFFKIKTLRFEVN